MKLVGMEEMQRLERRSEEAGVTTDALMEQAGLSVAREASSLLGDARGRPVLVLAGPGNNGGDGLVAARHLAAWGAAVTAYICVPGKALASKLKAAEAEGVEVVADGDDGNGASLPALLDRTALVVDAVLGTGRARSIEQPLKAQMQAVGTARERRPELRLLAVDIPSGVNTDTGAADPVTVRADVTVTLGLPKVGLYALPGAGLAGRVVVGDIGLPPGLDGDLPTELLTPECAAGALPRRPAGANKGTFGRLLVVGGSQRYVGATYLACAGAGRVGAGLMTLATLEGVRQAVAPALPEVTYLPLPGEGWTLSPDAVPEITSGAAGCQAVLVGCGLGHTDATVRLLRQLLLAGGMPQTSLVVDADALNGLAALGRWWEHLPAPAVLTPHPGEMARLCGRTVSEIQAERLPWARRWAGEWGHVVVLKGAHTVVAAPDGRARVSPFANPALASAGTGDVLAGAIAGLLGQGLDAFDAASCGVYLHAAAGERRSEEVGSAGLLAGDLPPLLPLVMKELGRLR